MGKKKSLFAGIDVGTTKICTTIAEASDNGMEVLGSGWAASKGLKKGVVVNLSETIESVKRSLERAESEAKSIVESAYVSVGGALLQGINSTGKTEVRSKYGEVTPEDIGRAVKDAKGFDFPENYEVIHVLTQAFTLDGQTGIVNPLGMSGRQLEVNLHLVLNATAVVQNIVNAINKSGVVVNGVVMQQLASGEAVLTSDEKELGTLLIDIGGGTTDVAIYNQGSIWHSEVFGLGGSLITKDIAIGLKAPLKDAEQMKREVGSVFPEAVPEEEVIEIGEVGTGRQRTLSRRLLCNIVQARCDEILHSVANVKKKLGLHSDLLTGAVLTGGGGLLDGLVERAEQLLDMPVRLGYPINVAPPRRAEFHPAYSTALGLLRYAREVNGDQVVRDARDRMVTRPAAATERMKNWIFERIG